MSLSVTPPETSSRPTWVHGRSLSCVVAVLGVCAGAALGGSVAGATGHGAGGRGASGRGASGHAHAGAPARTVLLGHSVQGRPIVAVRLGDPRSRRKALVLGPIHGDEPGGLRVAAALRRLRPLRGVDLWLVERPNPDGLARGTRRNAHGVDLNRNFPWLWRRSARSSRYYGGPRPLSEPESRILARLVLRLRPRVTVSYHQPYGFVVLPPGRFAARAARRYARLARWPGRRLARLPGTMVEWANRRLPGTAAFVVELGGSPPSRATALRHARAAARLAGGR